MSAETGVPLTDDGMANDCRHDSATGVDTMPLSDPAKVWRCDHCGLRWRADGRALTVIVTPIEWAEAIRAGQERAWDEGADHAYRSEYRHDKSDNPYRALLARGGEA